MFPPGLDWGPQANANVANHTEPLAYKVLCQPVLLSFDELRVFRTGDCVT